jgi:hypothetical protein
MPVFGDPATLRTLLQVAVRDSDKAIVGGDCRHSKHGLELHILVKLCRSRDNKRDHPRSLVRHSGRNDWCRVTSNEGVRHKDAGGVGECHRIVRGVAGISSVFRTNNVGRCRRNVVETNNRVVRGGGKNRQVVDDPRTCEPVGHDTGVQLENLSVRASGDDEGDGS